MRAVHRYVQAPRVVLVREHLNILQIAGKSGDAEAKSRRVRLHEDNLVVADNEEAPMANARTARRAVATIDHRHGQQIRVV